jgi:hypothetical protein
MICLQQYMDQFGTSLGIAVVAESFNVEAVKLDWIIVMNVEETGCASAAAAPAPASAAAAPAPERGRIIGPPVITLRSVAATLSLVSIPVAAATS